MTSNVQQQSLSYCPPN